MDHNNLRSDKENGEKAVVVHASAKSRPKSSPKVTDSSGISVEVCIFII